MRVPDEMWREGAALLGADVRELAPTLLEFRLDGATVRIRGQTTPFADPVSTEVASDKPLAYRILSEAGLPVPAHAVVDAGDLGTAAAFLERVSPPCIVKPVRGGGGEGITGEVRTTEQLRRALTRAGRFDLRVLIEQQLEGDSYRLLLLDGNVLDVLRRSRPQITGDGIATIQELVFAEYARRIDAGGAAGLKKFVVDLDCLFALERAGRRISSVLPAGESIVIKTATNYNGPGESETVFPPIPRELVEPARVAAEALGVRLAGVDVLTTDPGRPLSESGGVVLEVNPVPGLTHHYNVADPARATRIAAPILQALLQQAGVDGASRRAVRAGRP